MDVGADVGLVLLLGFLLFLGGVEYQAFAGWTTGLFLAGIFVLEWGYGILFESLMSGQTPGKRVMKLRLIKWFDPICVLWFLFLNNIRSKGLAFLI